MHFAYGADHVIPQPFDRLPNGLTAMALIAHLGGHAGLARSPGYQARFPEVWAKGFTQQTCLSKRMAVTVTTARTWAGLAHTIA